MKPSISIIIPAYNEENRIAKTLVCYTSFLNDKKVQYEIIVVCNGCIDNTSTIVNDSIKENENVKLLNYKKKLGKGGAVLEGLKVANGDYIGFLDADDAFDLEKIYENLIKNLDKYDCVIASKWKDQKFFDINEKTLKKILSRGWNLLFKILFGLNIKDTQAGAKFMTKKAIDSIDLNFLCKGFEFDVELLVRLNKKRNNVKEVYIPSINKAGSKFSVKYIFPMFVNLLRLKFSNI